MGKGQSQDVTALKGYGKSGTVALGANAWGNDGKESILYGGEGFKGYRSPGKTIGKGLNYWGEDDYAAAWGEVFEYQNYYDHDDWNCDHGGC